MEVAGPLGTPLGLAQRKRASPRVPGMGEPGGLPSMGLHTRVSLVCKPEIPVTPRDAETWWDQHSSFISLKVVLISVASFPGM